MYKIDILVVEESTHVSLNDVNLDYDTSKVVEKLVYIFIEKKKISTSYGEKAPTSNSSSTQNSDDT